MRYAVLVVLAGLLLASSASAAPFTVGAGFKPSVAVDAAGTAYMAWYGPESGTTSLQFCRVPRGATACDLARTIPAPGTSLSRPHVSVSGAVVRIVQYRYSVLPPQVFVFTSVDGGNTFDAGRSAGQAPFDEAVFGPGDTITGATNAWQNGGVVQQLPLSAGSAGASWAQLFATDHLYNGTVGLTPASTLLAIFTAGVADASVQAPHRRRRPERRRDLGAGGRRWATPTIRGSRAARRGSSCSPATRTGTCSCAAGTARASTRPVTIGPRRRERVGPVRGRRRAAARRLSAPRRAGLPPAALGLRRRRDLAVGQRARAGGRPGVRAARRRRRRSRRRRGLESSGRDPASAVGPARPSSPATAASPPGPGAGVRARPSSSRRPGRSACG